MKDTVNIKDITKSLRKALLRHGQDVPYSALRAGILETLGENPHAFSKKLLEASLSSNEASAQPYTVLSDANRYQLETACRNRLAKWVGLPIEEIARVVQEIATAERFNLAPRDVDALVEALDGPAGLVYAKIQSDDYRHNATFNARMWFEQASDTQIQALLALDDGAQLGGDYEADEVARWTATLSPRLDEVLDYCRGTPGVGFEVYLNSKDVQRWVRAHRAHLMGA